MARIVREVFPSGFGSREALNFEDHWELNIRIAYDDDFANEFGSNAEERYLILLEKYTFFLGKFIIFEHLIGLMQSWDMYKPCTYFQV